jgi:hypothetical protein
MMDELINQVMERTGLEPHQARTAVETVLGFLKERLPESVSGALDSVTGGTGADSSGKISSHAEELVPGIGSLIGGGKE